ncbi:MAG TPA: hypothetical protein VNN76_08220 [Bacteroidota bacterium]|nr:hypothetical protein [Bacteroidota bacterium]
MKRNRFVSVVILLVAWLDIVAAQNVQYLHTVLVGSDGNGRVKADGGEEAMGDLHDYFADSFGGRVRNKTVIQLSKKQPIPLGDAIGKVYSSCDSADLVVSVWAGPWQVDQRVVERSSLISPQGESLPAEYVLNFVQFLPAQSVLTFVLSPQSHEFPTEILQDFPQSTASGGKHIILVRPREKMDFDDVVDAFVDAVKAMRSSKELDTNNDGWVRFSEWLREFYKKAQAEKLSLAGFGIAKFPDYRLVQVKP